MAWLWMLMACREAPTTWMTPDDDVTAAVVQADGRMLAYVCGNNDDTRTEFSRWFEGSWTDDGFLATDGDWQLDGTLDGNDLLLSLTGPGDRARDWTAPGRLAAIYANDETCLDGAIATDDRVDGTWCGPDGTRFQVEPVETLTLGDTLELAVPDGTRVFQRRLP